MLITPKKAIYDTTVHCIRMGNCTLKNVNLYNYLGVQIDRELVFDDFFKQKCNKINLKLYQLAKMQKFIMARIATTIYKQAILPVFDYADFLVDSSTYYYIGKLDKLHEKALRLIDCNKHRMEDVGTLKTIYTLDPLIRRRKEHHCLIMLRLC